MKIEPFLEWPRRLGRGSAAAAATAAESPLSTPALPDLRPQRIGTDPHGMSPRQFAEWAHDLYIEGLMSWDDYRVAGFPSELHPSFDRTIGALTGERAAPDRPRDMIVEWERRYGFERRHHGGESPAARRCARILDLLRWQAEGRLNPPPAPRARRG